MLSCCNTAVTDIVLEADEASSTADIPRQQISIRVKKIERPDDRVLILSARTPRTSRLRFLAGQRARLSVDHVGDGFYPIASCPCDDMNLQFHIELDGDPIAAFLADSAKSNDLLALDGPVGAFVLDEDSPRSLVFVAEGIGFASIKGLIEHAMALDIAENIHLLWFAADGKPYLNNLCRAWNDALDNFHYRPLDSDALAHVDDYLLEQLEADRPDAYDYYVCGGDELRRQMTRFVEQRAIPSAQLNFESIAEGPAT